MTAPDLAHQKCKPCEGGVAPLKPQEITRLLQQLNGWEYRGGVITKTYEFKNYYQTMAFVNALAFAAHVSDHHPELQITYNRCVVRFNTHDVDGISATDFDCAAATDALLA